MYRGIQIAAKQFPSHCVQCKQQQARHGAREGAAVMRMCAYGCELQQGACECVGALSRFTAMRLRGLVGFQTEPANLPPAMFV